MSMNRNLLLYLINRYGYSEPIFLEDLKVELKDVNQNTLRQCLKRLVDAGDLSRFKYGIYYVPNPESMLEKQSLSVSIILTRRYIENNKGIVGYITGAAFANILQLSYVNPGNIEVVTNREVNRVRTVEYNERQFILRKPRTKVTEANFKLLQVLDLVNNYEKLNEKSKVNLQKKIIQYLVEENISKEIFDDCIKTYTQKTQKRFKDYVIDQKEFKIYFD